MAFGDVVQSASAPSNYPHGIGGNANVIWHADTSIAPVDLYELSTTDLSVVRNTEVSESTNGIGGDEGVVWHTNDFIIYERSPTDFSIVQQASTPEDYVSDIGGDTGSVWAAAFNTIYELSPSDLSSVQSSSAPTYASEGIGGSTDVVWYNSSDSDTQLHELSPSDLSSVRSTATPTSDPRSTGGSKTAIWHGEATNTEVYELEAPATSPSITGTLSSSVTEDDITLDLPSVDWNGEQGDYLLLRGESSGALSQFDTVTAGTATYTDTAKEDGEQFFYAVEAQNSAGTSNQSNEVFETTAVPAPTIGTPYADANSNVVVPWTKEDDSSDGGVDVERSTDGGASWSTVATSLSALTTEYTGAAVPDTETYTYRVRRYTDHSEARSGTTDVYVDYQVTITGTNAPITAGETLDVDVEVTNNGTIEGDQPVELTLEEQ